MAEFSDYLRQLALEHGLEIRELRDFAQRALELPLSRQISAGSEALTDQNQALLRSAAKRLAAGERVERILGRADFYGYSFGLNSETLIPRPDSEILVFEALRDFHPPSALRILDICSGSACLGLAAYLASAELRGQEEAELYFLDLSGSSLAQARENYLEHASAAQASFIEADFLTLAENDFMSLIKLADSQAPSLELIKASAQPLNSGAEPEDFTASFRAFDLVFFNPPYLTEAEYEQSSNEFKAADPSLALIGGKDGLLFYRQAASYLPRLLRPGGRLLIEYGAEQAAAVYQLFAGWAEQGFELSQYRDYGGHPRLLKMIYNK
ncbi:MAG: HemK/PrmC family methyltransferase [Eubacteriales bacterium]|nr:HemK/PrmC family methyltransferase [Eubacteriales bacterium]